MPGIDVLRTNHTSFTVSSLDRTLSFYQHGLGFDLLSRGPRDPAMAAAITGVSGAMVEIAFVRGGGHTFEFIEFSGPPDRDIVNARPCDTGFAHIAFDVSDIFAAIDAAAAYGVTPIGAPVVNQNEGPNQGAVVAYFRDPDGITIELIQPPPRRTERPT